MELANATRAMAKRTAPQCVRHVMDSTAGVRENVARRQVNVTAILDTLVNTVTLSAMEAI